MAECVAVKILIGRNCYGSKDKVTSKLFHSRNHTSADIDQYTQCFGSPQVHYRLWVLIPGGPTKLTNSLSDETLNQGPV